MRCCLALFVTAFVCAPAINAQEPEPLPTPRASPTPLMAPPPIKIISKEERAQIDSADGSKSRIRTTMDLAAVRLTRAEQLAKQGQYDDALTEVGSYEALIQDSLDFLQAMKRDSNKTRDLCKRVELALRGHGPRLTTMRRETPLEFAIWIKKVEEFARAARTEVLNTFYGHTVVREPDKIDKRKENPKATPTPTPKSNEP
ncbi:MAG TPA: hypothetical protein VFY51_00165 [Pyrinomonadaceae bacterium]|nr:hypothetical protein [Pyrinomonadaceae bacterium]